MSNQMKLRWILGFFFVLTLSLLVYFQEYLLTRLGNELLKRNPSPAFSEPAKIERIWLDSFFQIHIRGFSGQLKTRHDPVPIRIEQMDCEGSLPGTLWGDPLVCRLDSVVISNSSNQNIHGALVFQPGKNWRMDFTAQAESIDLQDVAWLDPDHLQGSSGSMKGTLTLRSHARGSPFFAMDFKIVEPGGKIQSEFFDLLRPFLPLSAPKDLLNKEDTAKRLMRYTRASLQLRTLQADKMSGTFRILLPDLPVDLNVNLEIRIDEDNAFFELARILGQFEVRT